MTKADTRKGEPTELRLDQIQVPAGFNPRRRMDVKALTALADSIRQHGLLQPLVVTATERGYVLVAGHRRLRAAQEAGLREAPVVVREADADTGGLDLALVENIVREQLDPVEEARAFERLIEEGGLTRKGVAERLSVPQRRVTERLQALELPDELHPQVASGAIPPGAVKALARLARIHPELPVLVAAKVGREPRHSWEGPLTWPQVASDPIAAVWADYDDEPDELPAGLFEGRVSYPAQRFSLSERARRDLAKWAELTGRDPGELRVRFEERELEQAEALNALHRSNEGYVALVAGQEVADQLACDYIARLLKAERAARREAERDAGRSRDQDGTGPGDEAISEEEAKERRRREREAEQEARREAAAYNAELGAAVVKSLSRAKVDERVVKVLTTLDIGGDLAGIAARGARYGFPGWVEQSEGRNGSVKLGYLSTQEAGAKARAYLEVAKNAVDVAGRCVALVVMARYAKEEAVAQSQRSFYRMPVPGALPWAEEVVDVIDQLAAERLPDPLTREVRERRAAEREQEERRAREREAARQRLDERTAPLADLPAPELRGILADTKLVHGEYSPEAFSVRTKLAEAEAAEQGSAPEVP